MVIPQLRADLRRATGTLMDFQALRAGPAVLILAADDGVTRRVVVWLAASGAVRRMEYAETARGVRTLRESEVRGGFVARFPHPASPSDPRLVGLEVVSVIPPSRKLVSFRYRLRP